MWAADAVMDFPKGGSGEIAAALARGVTKHAGCSVRVGTSVEEVVVEEDELEMVIDQEVVVELVE